MRLLLSALLCLSLLCSNMPAIFYTGENIPVETNDSSSTTEETPSTESTATATEPENNSDAGNSADLAASLGLSAPHLVLMEASTGTIIYEKDSHTSLHPASITKIMTLILIFDALSKGGLQLTDTVTVSEYAASMGGSQVYLEPGETQTVDTMIKCISVASANDACVAMAEHISGSESAFVEQMNERAKGLGMTDTHFVNCCGLDTDGHMTSAYDVALMSRELTIKYPQIHNYSTIWMENITHNTKRGSSEFGLTNTNKLIKQYQYATGLKTGSTDLAKYCVSATAEKDGIELIAVIMAAPDYKIRFADASALLGYGFSCCQLYEDKNEDKLPPLPVAGGVSESVPLHYEGGFSYLNTTEDDLTNVKKEIQLPEEAAAPVEKGTAAGYAVYTLNGKEIGSIPILYSETIEKATYRDYLEKVFYFFFS